MKVIRNMCLEELNSFFTGFQISSNINWATKRNSTSKGICFFGLENEEYANMWTSDICAVFEIDDNDLTESTGLYLDMEYDIESDMEYMESGSLNDTVTLKEYCIPNYSIDNAKLIYWYWQFEENTRYNVA